VEVGFAVFICPWLLGGRYVVIGVGMQEDGLMSYIDTTELWNQNFGYGISWILLAIRLYYGAWLDFSKACIRWQPHVSKFVYVGVMEFGINTQQCLSFIPST